MLGAKFGPESSGGQYWRDNVVGANVQRKRCYTNILEQFPGNNLRKKTCCSGGQLWTRTFWGPILEENFKGPIVNKKLMEVNLEQMLRANI